LAYISDNYISAAIAKISIYLKLSQSLAGSTLLAFSNGASDVITAIVATNSTEDDSLVMGSLFGASIFTTTIAMAIIILGSRKRKVEHLFKVRFSIIFTIYFLAIAVLLSVGSLNIDYIWIGLTFFLLYIIYIVVLEVQERKSTNKKLSTLSQQLLHLEGKVTIGPHEDELKQTLIDEINELKGSEVNKSLSFEEPNEVPQLAPLSDDENPPSAYIVVMDKVRRQILYGWKASHSCLRILYIVEGPLHAIIRLILPPVDDPMIFKSKILIYPFSAVFFCLASKGWLWQSVRIEDHDVPIWTIGLSVSLILLLATLIWSQWKHKPTPRKLYLFITIVTGLFWLDFLVSLIVDAISFVQLWTNASDLYLGMTFLGLSNSSVDLFVDYLLARRGLEVMAITGVFSGQMFNLLLGFGLSCIMQALSGHDNNFHIFDWTSLTSSKSSLMVFSIIVVFALILTWYSAALVICKGTFGKGIAITAILIYTLVLAAFTTIEVFWR